MLKTVLSALLFLIAISFANGWEGYYVFNETISLYVCQTDNQISGLSDGGMFYGNIKPKNQNLAFGKFFYLGDQFTGTRKSFRRFVGGHGRAGFQFDNVTNTFYAYSLPRGSKNITEGTLIFAMARNSTDVGTDRILNCGIIDRNSTNTKTVAGHWNTTAKSEVDAYICLTDSPGKTGGKGGKTNGAMFGTYTFLFTNGAKETLPGWYEGYCAANAQICGTVFYQNDVNYDSYTSFGAELIYRLSDDRVVIQHTRGAPGITGFYAFNTGRNELVRQSSTATTAQCNVAKSSKFDPTTCSKLSTKVCKDLVAYGFCELNKDNECRRVKLE